MTLRIVTWNIRSGGGSRLQKIADRLQSESADFLLLTEYRSKPGEFLKATWEGHHTAETTPPLNQNGLIAISTSPLGAVDTPSRVRPRSFHRWLSTYIPDRDLLALGVHIPNQNERWDKDNFWKRVCSFARRHRTDRALILGDFNTGLDADTENEKFLHSPQFQRLLDLGWVDCYRVIHGERREYSWYSPNGNNGYRLDHCFLSSSLAPSLKDARFDHEVRASRLSDHSLLSVDLMD